jgi:hypothetical protein
MSLHRQIYESTFIGDMTDECTGARGHDPGANAWPIYNPYICQLTNEYSNFFITVYFGYIPGWGAFKTDAIQTNIAYLTQFTTIQTKMSYNCLTIHKSHPEYSHGTIQTKTTSSHCYRRLILPSGSRWRRQSCVPPHRRVVILSTENI